LAGIAVQRERKRPEKSSGHYPPQKQGCVMERRNRRYRFNWSGGEEKESGGDTLEPRGVAKMAKNFAIVG